jgi:hypothetical protein
VPECRRCGSFVTQEFTRVFGDNEGQVDGCVDCRSTRELTSGVTGRETAADIG